MTHPIILTTHNRHTYLELTLNSLNYSLLGNTENEIHVFMIQPTQEVREVCKTAREKWPRISLYEIPNNVSFASVNIALQLLKPDIATVWEDDFILPQNARQLLPNWPKAFEKKININNYDMVAFGTSIQNVPFDYMPYLKERDFITPKPFEHEWIESQYFRYNMTGNSLTFTTKIWKAGYEWLKQKWGNPHHFASDVSIYEVSVKKALSSITGYHIGFNQEMDGYVKLGADRDRFPKYDTVQKVKNLQNDKEFEFDISKVLENI